MRRWASKFMFCHQFSRGAERTFKTRLDFCAQHRSLPCSKDTTAFCVQQPWPFPSHTYNSPTYLPEYNPCCSPNLSFDNIFDSSRPAYETFYDDMGLCPHSVCRTPGHPTSRLSPRHSYHQIHTRLLRRSFPRRQQAIFKKSKSKHTSPSWTSTGRWWVSLIPIPLSQTLPTEPCNIANHERSSASSNQ